MSSADLLAFSRCSFWQDHCLLCRSSIGMVLEFEAGTTSVAS